VSGSLFDTNIWIAVVFPTHPFHALAQEALARASVARPAVLCRSTQQSFLRLASSPTILKAYGAEASTNRDALIAIDSLLSLPQVVTRVEPEGTFELWRQLASRDTASPKLWMDAYLAAFALAGGTNLVTLDHDFKNFLAHGLDLSLLNANPPQTED
jgi:uncharacterized protein